MKVQPIYNNKILKKGLEFAADNSALFVSSVSLLLSTAVRPAVILSTPKTNKENKKYACIKSLASSACGFFITLAAATPLSYAIKKIDKNPQKYLKSATVKALQDGEKALTQSKRYKFATQLFKLGLGLAIAAPKAIMTCALIPPFMSKVFPENKNKNISFNGKGTEKLSKFIGKIIDTSPIKKLTEKFHNTNYEQHTINFTDAISTGVFIWQTDKSKKIKPERKKALMYNAGISTGLCIAAGYLVNSLISDDKIITKFVQANKNSPKLEKYIEGIKIAKPALILSGIYYILIPLISTFTADRFDKEKNS